MQIVDKIVIVPINEIVPYDKNPRKNDKTVDMLCKSIPKTGFNVPLVIDKNKVIVKGHARYLAALKLGMTELPCVVSEASAEEIKADRLADNKIFEFSKWLETELAHEVDSLNIDLDLKEFKLPVINFDFAPSAQKQEQEFKRAGFDMEEVKAVVSSMGGNPMPSGFSPLPFPVPQDAMPAPMLTTEDDASDDGADIQKKLEEQKERERRILEIIERQAEERKQKEAKAMESVSQNWIDSAVQRQYEIPKKPPKYFKVPCEECGHIMYIREGDAYEWE